MSPSENESNPEINLPNVVLPQPDSPTIPKVSPLLTLRFIPLSACILCRPVLNIFFKLFIFINTDLLINYIVLNTR